MNFSDICIYTRTYAGDREFLPYLYKSIDRFCSNWGEVVLVVEEVDYDAVRSYVPSWVKIVKEETFAPGAIQQKYSKITADINTSKDYVFHIDSDSVFTKSIDLSNLAIDGRPYLEYCTYDHLLKYQNDPLAIDNLKEYCKKNVIPEELSREIVKLGVTDIKDWMNKHYQDWIDNEFESWFSEFYPRWSNLFGVDVWREGTQSAIGLPVNHEFSRRPEKLYPRSLYKNSREHIERLHNQPFKEFIASRIGRQSSGTSRGRYFSDLNYLGAYLYNFMHPNIEWIDIEVLGYEHRPTFVKQFISFDLLVDGKLKSEAHHLITEAIGG